jgi:hypothetical protein
MRTRESVGLAAAAVLLGGGALLAYHLAVTDRRDREAARAREEMIAAIDRERADLQPAVLAANEFLGSLGGDDVYNGRPSQLTLTSAAFQARHQATGSVLRLTRPDGELFGAPNQDGPSFSDRWAGSVGGGALTYRGDVFRDGKVRGSYTIALVRDGATGRWKVDAFAVSE